MSPLSEVLSRLTDENNMHEDLSPETCPHKMEFPFMRWWLYIAYFMHQKQSFKFKVYH